MESTDSGDQCQERPVTGCVEVALRYRKSGGDGWDLLV